ncbi:MAG TPA: GAF domain-containing protein [Streptosporangiaceae bacterium]|nr:GAF domain-containing protein [Streptosporangiaceae bacterium]
MMPSAAPLLPSANSARLAEARERFLTRDPVVAGAVREPILASWWRSRDWKVAADRVELSYVRDPNLDTPLTRNAMPVLRNLHEHLDGQPISVILTDAGGVVLSRLTADRDLERHLDGVQLAPGFSYAEEHVGTNGIGTALEGGQPAHVFGHEHYAEDLEDLACAGVPIHDPLSGKTIGAVDLTCWRRDADALLVALAKTTADQITSALLNDSNARESRLLREYLRTCRHTSGIVLALSSDMVMMNDSARQVLDPSDQVAVLGHAADVIAGRRPAAVTVTLPTGAQARVHCRPLSADGLPGGPSTDGIIHVKLIEQAARPVDPGPKKLMFLPGLVGSAPLWLRGCGQVETLYERREWLALEGERGVGKVAVVRAVHQRRNPAGRFTVLDAADATRPDWLVRTRRELNECDGTLVLRNIDLLSARQLNVLSSALQAARAAGRQHALRVVVTMSRKRANADLTRVLRHFPSSVELPPLRHHIEDLHELVPFFLAKLSQQARLSCAPEAMQLLLRSRWPGNIEQLWQVLRQVARHRRSGVIHPADLPPECWTVSRRLLSPLESMERDAIVQGLLAYHGNKVRTAESLGMSRATIYRKIHEYGIVIPSG